MSLFKKYKISLFILFAFHLKPSQIRHEMTRLHLWDFCSVKLKFFHFLYIQHSAPQASVSIKLFSFQLESFDLMLASQQALPLKA